MAQSFLGGGGGGAASGGGALGMRGALAMSAMQGFGQDTAAASQEDLAKHAPLGLRPPRDQNEERELHRSKVAATRVDCFTVVRGEDE